MKTVAISQFGSGYAWLMYDSTSKLRIVKTPNQDPPPLLILQPLLVIDVWEHAYFLADLYFTLFLILSLVELSVKDILLL